MHYQAAARRKDGDIIHAVEGSPPGGVSYMLCGLAWPTKELEFVDLPPTCLPCKILIRLPKVTKRRVRKWKMR